MTTTDTTVIVLALTCVMVVLEVLKRFIEKRLGDKEGQPTIVNCPNKIETLAETMRNLEKIATKANEMAGHAVHGVNHLVEQHAPEDGVEQWKLQPRFERMWEEMKDTQAKMLTVMQTMSQQTLTAQNRAANLLEKLIEIETETRTILLRNGGNK